MSSISKFAAGFSMGAAGIGLIGFSGLNFLTDRKVDHLLPMAGGAILAVVGGLKVKEAVAPAFRYAKSYVYDGLINFWNSHAYSNGEVLTAVAAGTVCNLVGYVPVVPVKILANTASVVAPAIILYARFRRMPDPLHAEAPFPMPMQFERNPTRYEFGSVALAYLAQHYASFEGGRQRGYTLSDDIVRGNFQSDLSKAQNYVNEHRGDMLPDFIPRSGTNEDLPQNRQCRKSELQRLVNFKFGLGLPSGRQLHATQMAARDALLKVNYDELYHPPFAGFSAAEMTQMLKDARTAAHAAGRQPSRSEGRGHHRADDYYAHDI